MTGREDELLPEGVPAFDDPAYDDLRAELAGLEPVGPMPADVAARLDAVLTDLSGRAAPSGGAPSRGESAEPGPAPLLGDPVVVPLRRRSRAGRRLLVAAAAVVAVGGGGIGLANVVQNGSGDSDSGSVAAGDSAEAPAAVADAESGGGSTGRDGQNLADGLDTGFAASTTPRLRTDRFAADASALLGGDSVLLKELKRAEGTQANAPTPLSTPRQAPSLTDEPGADEEQREGEAPTESLDGLASAAQRCATDRITGGVARPVLLDGEPAILVVYPAVDGARVVQARSCDANTVLISATVPAS